ncbi:sensor histidine kinase [Nocardia macrotermitis]|uniref:sensor histidine kinase n=1 Tax=Nocardia macrotermitis TaxID=2585198 RepID=UPI0029E80C56|nr:nitrate- and nitrite sensing domain-containing protein [Nocardia macrotermitis]
MAEAVYLVREGQHERNFSSVLENANKYSREMIASVEQERLLSVWRLAGGQNVSAQLGDARTRLDNAIQGLVHVASDLADVGAANLQDTVAGFTALRDQLPIIRGRVDARVLPIADAYGIYTKLLSSVVGGTLAVERTANDSGVTFALSGVLRISRAMEGISRSSALSAAITSGAALPPELLAEYRNIVGYSRTELAQLAEDLDGSAAAAVKDILATPAWRVLGAMEDFLIRYMTSSGKPELVAAMPASISDWKDAADQINQKMLGLWQSQSDRADHAAVLSADRSSRNSLEVGIGMLGIAILAFALSLWLANRLIGRLRRLRIETLVLAEERLPETIAKLNRGEGLENETATGLLDFGSDEIGSVAAAFNHAHTAAVAAAAAEARTMDGVRAVFLNIAHRSQIVVHKQLELLDEAEQRQEDPELLDLFFRLDHLATRGRRNAENLIILAGGRPGRQWRWPVPLVDLIRSAVGETEDYARVRPCRVPPVCALGPVVADLIHLLAELIDNALSFSPPQSRVEVSATVVGKGVVIEVSDQGMGIKRHDLERINEMLRKPPDFGVQGLFTDSRLGLFVVARLGAGHGISVQLAESDYGGVRAIVLMPKAVVTAEDPTSVESERGDRPRSRERQVSVTRTPVPAVSPPATAPAIQASDTEPGTLSAVQDRPRLPRRRRQKSLAPELAEPLAPEQLSPQLRSPEEARGVMSAIANGTRQARRSLRESGPLNESTE